MSPLLPPDHLERVDSWGQAQHAMAYVFRPSTVEGMRAAFDLARRAGCSVALRGAGRSYGDAALNSEQMLLDLTRMRRVLDWDPEAGVISVEPGVTIGDLWRYVLGDGWWPAVVPGTMQVTIGGCAGMNVHGKNNWVAGTFGEHILSFEALLPGGETVTCSPQENANLFHAMIGGLGLLGCFTRVTLKLKRVHSGWMEVQALAVPHIEGMLEEIDRLKEADYVVGWADGMARGRALGRGQIHVARELEPGEDPAPAQSLRLENQELPDTLLGLLPKSLMWRLMKPFVNNPGMWLINSGKYWASRLSHGHRFTQSHAAFHFLLDYIPGWKRSYLPGGLIQYQAFVPKEQAAQAFREMLARCQAAHLPTYLAVLKRHRPDPFLLTHAVDGVSLAMDFKVTQRNRARLASLAQELDEVVLQAGGRFYFAKDSTLRPETARAFLGQDALKELKRLKERCDPEGLLQTNLARRLFPDLIPTA